jgi:uncharacterized membrane protein
MSEQTYNVILAIGVLLLALGGLLLTYMVMKRKPWSINKGAVGCFIVYCSSLLGFVLVVIANILR